MLSSLSPFWRRLILVFALIELAGCSTTVLPPVIADFSQCVEKGVATQVQTVLAEIETALVTQDFKSALIDIAKRVGATVVDCAVSEIGTKARGQLRDAPHDDLAKIKIANATAWLERK